MKNGMSKGEFELLVKIIEAGGEACASDLAKVGWKRSTITCNFNKLLQKGYLTKERGIDENGHKVYFSITELGHDTLKKEADWYLRKLKIVLA